MYKANVVFISFFIIFMVSSLLFYKLYFNNHENRLFKSNYSYRGVKLVPENAPALSKLFDVENDSHDKFTSSRECLKCHVIGMEIKGKIKAPQIAHNILEHCISCHVLATNER